MGISWVAEQLAASQEALFHELSHKKCVIWARYFICCGIRNAAARYFQRGRSSCDTIEYRAGVGKRWHAELLWKFEYNVIFNLYRHFRNLRLRNLLAAPSVLIATACNDIHCAYRFSEILNCIALNSFPARQTLDRLFGCNISHPLVISLEWRRKTEKCQNIRYPGPDWSWAPPE
jgi:hypothetical protein